MWLPGILVLLLSAGAICAWHAWGSSLAQRPEYLLSSDRVNVTEQPKWIHADVKAEVIRDGTLTDASILDRDVTVKVAQAFELHAWVADVKRVSKRYPGEVDVELVYRRPIAMVELRSEGKRWLLPVDGRAVLLPGEDFSRKQAQDYLRIATGNVAATGPVGTQWEDPRVVAAVRIATVLNQYRQKLNLRRISLARASVAPTYSGQAEFEVETTCGVRLMWGHAPGEEGPGEASTHQKITALLQYVQANGALEGLRAGQDLDIRAGVVTPVARTARLP